MFALIERFRNRNKHRKSKRRTTANVARRARLGNTLLRCEVLEDRQMLSAATTTLLQMHPALTNYGQPVDLAAKVTTSPPAAKGQGPTGTVQFVDVVNGDTVHPTVLGTVSLSTWCSTAHLVVNNLPVGSNSITAVYSGDANFTTSTSTAVVDTVGAAATRTTLLASGNPGVANSNVTFTAIVSGVRPACFGSTQIAAPTGTMNFTVDGGTAVAGTLVGTSNGSAIYQFTPATPLSLGTHSIVASYGGDTNYNASTSATLTEQIVAAVAGSVTVGTSTTPATLWGGRQTVGVSVTETVDGSGNGSVAPGATVTYTDTWRGISLSGATVTGVVFSSNGHQAEISGTANNTNGSIVTPVTFTMIIDSGTGQRFSKPSVSVSIIGAGINYCNTNLVATGGVAVTGTGSTTIPPLGIGPFRNFQNALSSIFSDFGQGFHGQFHGWRF